MYLFHWLFNKYIHRCDIFTPPYDFHVISSALKAACRTGNALYGCFRSFFFLELEGRSRRRKLWGGVRSGLPVCPCLHVLNPLRPQVTSPTERLRGSVSGSGGVPRVPIPAPSSGSVFQEEGGKTFRASTWLFAFPCWQPLELAKETQKARGDGSDISQRSRERRCSLLQQPAHSEVSSGGNPDRTGAPFHAISDPLRSAARRVTSRQRSFRCGRRASDKTGG